MTWLAFKSYFIDGAKKSTLQGLQSNKEKYNETSYDMDVNETEKEARIFGVVSLDELHDMEVARSVK